ncbi:hypothetical protein [Streptomyces boninensis]|uniref:DUF459 domain-containing protein n=1 Tax=Streptomyces boninensis TaxID=2039455 RepID=UPI003B217959
MRHRRWVWPLFAGLLLVTALGWGAAVSVSNGDGGDDGAGTEPGQVEWSDQPGKAGAKQTPSASASASPTAPKAPDAPRRVLYLGDSLAMETQNELGSWVRRGGADYGAEVVGGTTICDYIQGRKGRSLVKADQKAAALVKSEKPGVVVMQFWGNAWGYTPCMDNIKWGTQEYYERYAGDARAVTEQIEAAAKQAGTPRPRIVWVLQPPDALNPARTDGVNDIYRRQARSTRDLTADMSKRLAGPDGKWAEQVDCDAYEQSHGLCKSGRVALHRGDDPQHFCLAKPVEGGRPCPVDSPGVIRYSRVVADVVDGYFRPSSSGSR